MTWTLLTNDDGVDSPALLPFARALAADREVKVVVPDRERSWIGKAISRHEPVDVTSMDDGDIEIWTCNGYPADAVQLGIHALFDSPPVLVISGINLGYNHGAGFLLSSGTVGAAFEGWVSGIRSVAFSAGTTGHWATWRNWIETDEARGSWERLAALCVDLENGIAGSGLYDASDVVSVNLPFDADTATPRRVTTIARTGYDRLFQPSADRSQGDGQPADGAVGRFTHDYRGGLIEFGGMAGTDVATARLGHISITPIRMPEAPAVPERVRAALETPQV